MSTTSPLPSEQTIAAKPNLNFYSTLENIASANTSQENKTQDAQTKNTLSLEDIYEKSKSTQSYESETLLYEHEEKQNLKTEETLKEKTKEKTKIKTEEKSDSEDDHLDGLNHFTEISNAKKNIEKKLKELQSEKKRMVEYQDSENMERCDDEIAELKTSLDKIGILQKKLSPHSKNKNPNKTKNLSDGHSSDGENIGSNDDKEAELSPKSKSNLTKTIIKRTTTKPRSSADVDNNSVRLSSPLTSTESKDTKQNIRDDIHQFANIEDRKRIIKIDKKILKGAKFADKLILKIKQCEKKIENFEEFDESTQSSDEEFPTDRSTKLAEQKKKLANSEYR